MTRTSSLAPMVSLLACAVGCAAPDVGAAGSAIVNGERELGRPEVVFLYRMDGAACTGAIIAPRVVLTADHCVAARGGGPAPAYYFRVYTGSSLNALTAEYRVSEVRQVANPGVDGANDVALLVLSSPAAEAPIEIARTDPTSLWGQNATAVGFGQTPSGGSGTKYRTTALVEGVQQGLIFVDPSVCSGDSGGPLIGSDGLVYGVASFIYSPDGVTEPRCGTAPGAYNAIYQHVEFIDAVLAETGSCVASGAEICNGEDDDCDEVVDEGCNPIGSACTSGSECVGGLCADTSAGRICTSTCDPLRPHVGCGTNAYCAQSNGCEGHCVPGVYGPGRIGDDCAADTECASLHCVDPGDGRQRCLEPCQADRGLCLAGEACSPGPGGCGACVPEQALIEPHGLGEPCDVDDDCRGDMVCHEYAGIRECAAPCTDSCGEGFECRAGLCIRDRRQGVGGVCVGNADCGEAICAAQGGRTWCTAQCGSAEDCPRGFDCVAAGGTNVCAPVAALEGERCTTNEECVTGLCASSGGSGICTSLCSGRDACAPGFECRRSGDGTTAVCSPYEPASGGRGGCRASGPASSGGGLALGALAALALVLGARRRAR